MIPEAIQNLKNNARQVKADAAQIRAAVDDQWWTDLVMAGALNLGPLWEFVTNSGKRPHHFSREKTTDFAFHILLPGHRTIYATFRGDDATIKFGATWRRSVYYGVNVADEIENGRGHWMVEPRDRNKLMSYHHTLGAALLAAELS